MKINNPNQVYSQKQREKLWELHCEKWHRKLMDSLPEFLKEYHLTINSPFKEIK